MRKKIATLVAALKEVALLYDRMRLGSQTLYKKVFVILWLRLVTATVSQLSYKIESYIVLSLRPWHVFLNFQCFCLFYIMLIQIFFNYIFWCSKITNFITVDIFNWNFVRWWLYSSLELKRGIFVNLFHDF